MSTIDSSVYDVSDNNFKIVEYPKFSYFPLSIGNKWYFHFRYQEEYYKVINETILSDGKSYAKLNAYLDNNLIYDGWAYLREDSSKIIEYPNKVVMDFNMKVGDTLPDGSTLYEVLFEYVFDRERTTYYFYRDHIDSRYFFSYTDSIGFNIIYKDRVHSFNLFRCEIDGKEFGAITSLSNKGNTINNFQLSQNYPNPFNPNTTIIYSIPKTGFVSLKVYDLLGKEISTLVNEEKPAGNYDIEFDGSGLTSGIYFYQLKAGSFVETKKFILMK